MMQFNQPQTPAGVALGQGDESSRPVSAATAHRPVSLFRAPLAFLRRIFRAKSPTLNPPAPKEETRAPAHDGSEKVIPTGPPFESARPAPQLTPPSPQTGAPPVETAEVLSFVPESSFADLREEEERPAVRATVEIDSLVEMELPPLPGSALRVAMLSLDMNVSTNAVAEAIGCDPILAGRILRAANSPLYALERKFTTLPMAVNALGNLAINQLVVIYAVSDAFQRNSKHYRLERPLWRHSVAVGVTARELCAAVGLRRGEEAFLCGLLHDMGKLLLIRHNADLYAQVEEESDEGRRLAREQEIYGFTHAEVGALVAGRWNLDDQIGKAIFDHHLTRQSPETSTMTHIINAADRMANAAGVGLREESGGDLAGIDSLAALGLTTEQAQEIWEKAEDRLDEMMHVLSSLI